jgi:DNA-binding transcriptional MerR regulator
MGVTKRKVIKMLETYRVSELAQKAEVTKRTIHYYVNRGLLPPPQGAGVGSFYNEEHFLKLLIIKGLQKKYLPLDKIRELIAHLNLEEARQMVEEEEAYINQNSIHETEAFIAFSKEDPYESPTKQLLLKGQYAEKMQNIERELDETDRKSYIRMYLGMGIELHYPAELFKNEANLITSIEKYCRKLIDEN